MDTETNSLVKFSDEHKIAEENFNILNLKLNDVIQNLESLVENKNSSVLQFAQEIIKGQMAIIDFRGNDNYHTHQTQRQIEKELNIEQGEFPIPTFFKTPGKPVAPQVMSLKANKIDAIEWNSLVTNITNKPFSNLPAITAKTENLPFWLAISGAGIIAVGGYAIYKIWNDNKKSEINDDSSTKSKS